MMKRNKIVLLMPYFGKLPSYFGAYLKSIENKLFDVLWISDLLVENSPANFKTVLMSLEDVRDRMIKTLGTYVVINDGRRLCDFRPMYGQIFSDLIEGYDYFGWGDCDLVYGDDFNTFLEQVVLPGEYDAISLHKDFLTGPTCFLRNNETMKSLYKKANNWKDVCSFKGNGGVYIFDECGGNFHDKLFSGEMTLEDCSKIRDSFSAVLWREAVVNIFREEIINESPLKNGEVVMLKNGHLTIDNKSIPVFHFVLAKVPRWFQCSKKNCLDGSVVRITRYGFFYGEWEWMTRVCRVWCRVICACVNAIKAHGFKHLFKRFFK